MSDEGEKQRFGAGGNSPLSNQAERGVTEVLQPSSLTGSRFADEAHQRVLVGHKVTLQDGHVAGRQSVYRHALEPQVFQNTVAALSLTGQDKGSRPSYGGGSVPSRPGWHRGSHGLNGQSHRRGCGQR